MRCSLEPTKLTLSTVRLLAPPCVEYAIAFAFALENACVFQNFAGVQPFAASFRGRYEVGRN